MVTVAKRAPIIEGSKVTLNVALASPATLAGAPLTANSAALSEVMDMMFSVTEPVLAMVNVRATVPPLTFALPKSVRSAVSGETSPAAMVAPLPVMYISGCA